VIVVSDTTSLNYLVLISRESILPALFGKVYAPPAVLKEMRHPGAPAPVRNWADHPSDWLIVQAPTQTLPLAPLGAGETEAILLAYELQADLLLTDDRRGVAEAKRLGLPVIGTLNVLQRASGAGLLNLAESIEALKQTTFRWSEELIDEILGGDQQP